MSADAAEHDDPAALAGRIAELVAPGSRPLIALDHDGTLSPIASRPELARPADGALEAIASLGEVADVVIISGRGLDDLTARFAGVTVELVSEHGLRHRRIGGEVTQLVDGLDRGTLDDVRRRLSDVLAATDGTGWLVEDKQVTVAVHHRLVAVDALEPTLTRVREVLDEAARRGGTVQTGKAVLELRPSGADKGAALRALADARPPALVVMIGDDATDEAALAVAESSGGVGVLVADRPRASAASTRLTDPTRVVTLLVELARALRQGR